MDEGFYVVPASLCFRRSRCPAHHSPLLKWVQCTGLSFLLVPVSSCVSLPKVVWRKLGRSSDHRGFPSFFIFFEVSGFHRVVS